MTFRGWQVMVMVLIFAVVSAAASMLYATRVAADSERKWCGIVGTMDDAYRQAPPQTPTGQEIASNIRQLRVEFGCE